MRATNEAVSGVEHGKATFVLVGQVLENPTNPLKRLRSPDTSQRDSRLQDEPFFFLVWEPRRDNISNLLKLYQCYSCVFCFVLWQAVTY